MIKESENTLIIHLKTTGTKTELPPSFLEMRYKTCECGTTFYKDSDLNKHFIETEHKKITRDVSTYQCNICTKVLDDKNSMLQHHLLTHKYGFDTRRIMVKGQMMVTTKTCEICGKILKSNTGLLCHMATHTGEKPYPCNICDKKFASKLNLKHHINSHTGERPFFCQVCPMTFACPSNLRRHMMVHNGIRPHKCDICTSGFYTKFDLNLHKKRMHYKDKLPTEETKVKKKTRNTKKVKVIRNIV